MQPVTRSLPLQCVVSDDVWDLIAPAVPDCLEDMGGGVYQATWWKPVPPSDIEVMQQHASIDIVCAPFEPKHLPNGIALRFWVRSH